MTRQQIKDRIEDVLWSHGPAHLSQDWARGVMVRCECQPADALPMGLAVWYGHVADAATDAAIRLD